MRGTKARALRLAIYGQDFSPRHRSYQIEWRKCKRLVLAKKKGERPTWIDVEKPIIHADSLRQSYQKLKGELYGNATGARETFNSH